MGAGRRQEKAEGGGGTPRACGREWWVHGRGKRRLRGAAALPGMPRYAAEPLRDCMHAHTNLLLHMGSRMGLMMLTHLQVFKPHGAALRCVCLGRRNFGQSTGGRMGGDM